MPGLITPDFLLRTPQARRLYHQHAASLPIIDYHSHLSPSDVAVDTRFANLTRVWLDGDHYKWRALRTNGVAEHLITGDASDRDKFDAWAATVPRTLRNPLYHWTHLELNRPFGINDRLLSPATAAGIWDQCNAKLATPAFSARGILTQMRVQVVCTTDDPVDDLASHQAIAASGFATQVRPTWRPDRGLMIDEPARLNPWLDQLAACTDVAIRDWDDYLAALRIRHAYFHAHGCRLSDHGLETMYAEDWDEAEVAATFAGARAGQRPSPEAGVRWKSALLHAWAVMDHAAGWVQQFHLGPIRNLNSRLMARFGADAGCDSIGDAHFARPLARFLDRLDRDERLAKTVIYNLNPRDNELLAAMVGNFQDGVTPGKIQFGAAWWFNDQRDGIERQLSALSNLSLLSRSVGMLTDSRSFLSFTRHEYFRRILCDVLGREMADGLLPDDDALVGQLVADVCYHNAASYFPFRLTPQSSQ